MGVIKPQQHAKNAAKSGVVVGNFRLSVSKRLALSVIGSLLVIALIISGVILITRHSDKSNKVTDTAIQQSATPIGNIHNYVQNGQDDLAIDHALAQARQATVPAEEAGWYLQASELALNDQKFSDALRYAQQAEAAAPSSDTAYAITQAYKQQGDRVNAKKYLQLTIDRLDKTSVGYKVKMQQYNQELAGL